MQEKKTKCYNCQSEDFKIIHLGVRDNDALNVIQCKNCGLTTLSDDSHINEKFYMEGKMLDKTTNLECWIKNTYQDDKRRFDFIKKKFKKNLSQKTLTDFGCGNGGFLNLAKEVCKKVYGVELHKGLFSYFETCNLDVKTNINDINELSDIITMFHVLEHLKEPIDTLKKLKNNLAEDGKLIIEVPNANDALLKLYKCKKFAQFTYWSCHLYLFNEKTLCEIAKKAGYKVTKIQHVQRYTIMNHLYWLIKGKPGGHIKWGKYDSIILNKIYSQFLSLFKITDTIILELSI